MSDQKGFCGTLRTIAQDEQKQMANIVMRYSQVGVVGGCGFVC